VPKYELRANFYRDIEDFTFFEKSTELQELFGGTYSEEVTSKLQLDEAARLKLKESETHIDGRLNLSRCFAGEFVSCSFRADRTPEEGLYPYHAPYKIEASGYNPRPSNSFEHKPAEQKAKDVYMNSWDDLCDVVYKRVFRPLTNPRGLIVISGATACGKSNIARGLIYMYLKSLSDGIQPKRRPHLVTYEEPIDKYWAISPEAAQKTGIDYTPREARKDVRCLQDAVEAALRQTPTMFFVGETRKSEDWKVLLQFASTGHVSMTTSHAGSLTEAMGQLIRAVDASTPGQRSEVANRISALIHLRTKKFKTDTGTGEMNITIPAIWVRSAVSTKALMADGLTSLLPYHDPIGWDEEPGTAGNLGCLGRSWFAEQLLIRAGTKIGSRLSEQIKRMALSWDLEGL
jgi:hypothetical protein